MKLSIAFVNDVHAYLEPHAELFYEDGKETVLTAGGYARIASVVNDIRNKNVNTLLFDGGDTFHGTLPVIQSKGEVLIPVLNKLAFDAMVCHWDFAYGPAQLKKLAGKLSYPVLGINVYNEDGSLFFQPYMIKEIEKVKIAVIGICSNIIDKMPERFSEGLKITDGMNELPAAIEQVKAEGADVIMLLSHNGFPQDVELVSKVAGIDICLSAHTHNRLYETVKIDDAILIQCGCHGSFVGHLTVDIEQKKIVHHTYQLITVDEDIEPDAEVEKIVTAIMKPFQHLKDDKIGETENILHRYDTLNSTTDDFLLKAICAAADVQIGFSNGWRYGAPIAAGAISKWDLHNIIPMNPVVSTVELTGEEIKNMLEENLERTFACNPMKQMGGYAKRCFGISIKMRIENSKGHRIQQIFAAMIH
jgi:S-sulfosulfanyl-L-cysteine sulfohydrolase